MPDLNTSGLQGFLQESNSENGIMSLNPLTLTAWRDGRGKKHPYLA